MGVVFLAYVCAFAVTAKVLESGSLSVETKISGGHEVFANRLVTKFIGGLVYNETLKNSGVFISPSYFITSAQSMFIKTPGNLLRKATVDELSIVVSQDPGMTGTWAEDDVVSYILRYQIHPQYNPEQFLNDIALLYVTQLNILKRIDQSLFPKPSNEAVYGESVDLYAFQQLVNAPDAFECHLKMLPVDIINPTYCRERFPKIFNEKQHFCGESSKGSAEKTDIGGPVINCNNMIVGLLTFIDENEKADDIRNTVYLSSVDHIEFIDETKIRLQKFQLKPKVSLRNSERLD